jgi:hypothetical protein
LRIIPSTIPRGELIEKQNTSYFIHLASLVLSNYVPIDIPAIPLCTKIPKKIPNAFVNVVASPKASPSKAEWTDNATIKTNPEPLYCYETLTVVSTHSEVFFSSPA